MSIRSPKSILFVVLIVMMAVTACQPKAEVSHVEEAHVDEPNTMQQQSGLPDKPAIPNDSGIEGV